MNNHYVILDQIHNVPNRLISDNRYPLDLLIPNLFLSHTQETNNAKITTTFNPPGSSYIQRNPNG